MPFLWVAPKTIRFAAMIYTCYLMLFNLQLNFHKIPRLPCSFLLKYVCVYDCLTLYHCTIHNEYTWIIIVAPGFGIGILTYLATLPFLSIFKSVECCMWSSVLHY